MNRAAGEAEGDPHHEAEEDAAETSPPGGRVEGAEGRWRVGVVVVAVALAVIVR